MTKSVNELLQGFLYDTITDLTNMDCFNKVVQFDDDPNNVASGETTVILSGPPILRDYKGTSIQDLLQPLGAVQQFSIQEGKQITVIRELGSKLARQAVGSGQYNVSMSRVLTKYGNIGYGLYAWLHPYMSKVLGETDPSITLSIDPGAQGTKHFVSPESEIFNIPFGLLCITGSGGGEVVNIQYLERCQYLGSGNSKTAGQSLIVENVNISVTRPVAFTLENGDARIPTLSLKSKNKTLAFKISDPTL